jgi:hypothetical protein
MHLRLGRAGQPHPDFYTISFKSESRLLIEWYGFLCLRRGAIPYVQIFDRVNSLIKYYYICLYYYFLYLYIFIIFYTMYGLSAGPTPGPRPALSLHLSDLNRHSSKRKWAVSRSRAAAQTLTAFPDGARMIGLSRKVLE